MSDRPSLSCILPRPPANRSSSSTRWSSTTAAIAAGLLVLGLGGCISDGLTNDPVDTDTCDDDGNDYCDQCEQLEEGFWVCLNESASVVDVTSCIEDANGDVWQTLCQLDCLPADDCDMFVDCASVCN